MNDAGDSKLIVAFVARGKAHELAASLYDKLGLDAFHYGHGRASGALHAGAGSEFTEVDFLSVIVSAARADEVFAFIYDAGEMDRPGGGLVAQMPLARAAATGLPHMSEGTVA
jgi:hypothetical protein